MSIFDDLGGLVQQGEKQVSGFLTGLLPNQNGNAASRPMVSKNPPLPSTSPQPNKPISPQLLGATPAPAPRPQATYNGQSGLQQLGQFFQNTGVTQLGKNIISNDTSNPNTMAAQIANPKSTVNQVQNQIKSAINKASIPAGVTPLLPFGFGFQKMANVTNAGITSPIQLAANPQMWFADDPDNHLKDVMGPLVKKFTGEDVPPTIMSYQGRAQQLQTQQSQLLQAQQKLQQQEVAGTVRQVDIDAYNNTYNAYTANFARYQTDYAKSQQWWTNSNTAKTLSVLGQIATFPAGFAAGAATFAPNLIADPIGSGEGMIGQVQQGVDFVQKLVDPSARASMTSDEWASNVQNIAMLAGMLYGAKEIPHSVKDTILGRKPEDPAELAALKQKLHDSVPELKNPAQADHAITPTVDPRSPAGQVNAHIEQRMQDASQLRDAYSAEQDPARKAVILKQINDITDEIQTLRQQSKQYARAASQPAETPNPAELPEWVEDTQWVQSESNDVLAQRFKFLQDQITMYRRAIQPTDIRGLGRMEVAGREVDLSQASPHEVEDTRYLASTLDSLSQQARLVGEELERRGLKAPSQPFGKLFDQPNTRDVAKDLGNELINEQRPQYTQPVYPSSGSPEGLVDGILKRDSADFTRASVQQQAMRRRPQDYASVNAATGEEAPIRITKSQMDAAIKAQNWRTISSDKLEYGWLLPNGRAIDLNYSPYISGADPRSIAAATKRADHNELWQTLETTIGQPISAMQWADIQRNNNMIQLRRGYGEAANDYYFAVPQWNGTIRTMIDNYLFNRLRVVDAPKEIVIEGIPLLGTGTPARSIAEFSWDEFKNNNFTVSGLDSTYSPALTTPGAEHPYDQYAALRRAKNQIDFFENRGAQSDAQAIDQAYKDAQDIINKLPADVPSHMIALRDELTRRLNEKGYPTSSASSAESTPSETGQGHNQAPPGAPEGSTATTAFTGPKNSQVTVWQTDPKSSGTVSAYQRGSVDLLTEISQFLSGVKDENPDAVAPKLKAVNYSPANIARREKEVIATAKAKMPGFDPQGIATPDHIVFDSTLKSEANFDPYTGMININPAKGMPETWIRSAANSLSTALNKWMKKPVGDQGFQPLTTEQLNYAVDWVNHLKNLTQSQIDWSAIAEEMLHKNDIDYFNTMEYLRALTSLPLNWWDHAYRSGLADVVDGGIRYYEHPTVSDPGGWKVLATNDGNPITSWTDGYELALNGDLPTEGMVAVFNTFAEFRVTQLRNYHGIPGTGYTYRVPEVMFREFLNPSLIQEGAKLGGDSFEQYVRTQTAPRLSTPVPPEEAALSQQRAASGFSPENAANATGNTTPALSAPTPAGGGGFDTANQGIKIPKNAPNVGDMLQVNRGTKDKPDWQNFFGTPLKDLEDVRKAVEIVNTAGASLGQGASALANTSYAREFRIVGRDNKVRTGKFPSGLSQTPETPQIRTGLEGTSANVTPETFHGIPVPEITPPAEGELGNRAAQGGFNRRALRLAEEQPLSEKPVSVDIPDSIGAKFGYEPLAALGRTQFPGNWDDFLAAMSQEPDSLARKLAQPYWDKLDPKWQKAFMEAMQEPGVQQAVMDKIANPTVETAQPEGVNSPAFLARQAKIQDYQQKVANSGPLADKLYKSINTQEGLLKYARFKATIAAMRKEIELGPGVAEKEATNLAGAEFTKVLNDITGEPPENQAPRPNRFVPNVADLISKFSAADRNLLTSRVTERDTKGNLVGYRSLVDFINAYAGGEEKAKKIYNKLNKDNKQLVRMVVDQIPTSLTLPVRYTHDQTIIPETMQGPSPETQEHINPVSVEDMKPMVENASKTLVRHGSTENNEQGLTRAWNNVQLSSLGRLQARNVAKAFSGMRNLKIVSHTLDRAIDTAKEIAMAAKGSRVSYDPDLRPWNLGTALTGIGVKSANPRMLRLMTEQPDFVPDGGESWNQFVQRNIAAFQRHLYDKDVFVISTRNQRLFEDWLQQGMPSPENFQPDMALKSAREIGPGGIMTLAHQPDGSFTIQNKASQKPATAESLQLPTAPKEPTTTEPLKPTTIQLRVPQRTQPFRISRPAPEVPPEPTTQARIEQNVRFKINYDHKDADTRGETVSKVPQDINDQIDAIVANPSILASDPLKVAATMAQVERKGVEAAQRMEVPIETLRDQVRKLDEQVARVTGLMADRAKAEAEAAAVFAPRAKNQAAFNTSLKAAKDHQNRMAQGEDYNISANQAAKTMGFKNIDDARARIKDAAESLLPSDHRAYSLSPGFKEVFVDPKAAELIRQEGLSEPSKQGVLPLSPEISMGANAPLPANPRVIKPTGRMVFVDGDRVHVVKPTKATVVPAEAEHLAAHTPPPGVPAEIHPRVAAKQYKPKINRHAQKSTKDLTEETTQLVNKVNMDSPDLFHDTELEQAEEEAQSAFEAAKQGRGPTPSDAVQKANTKKGGNGGGGKKPPFNPMKGWDDARNYVMSFDGNMRSLALRYDYALKMMLNVLDPSQNTAHPVGMANAFLHARTEAIYVGDEIHGLLSKLVPEDQIARHQAIAKAVGGSTEQMRTQAMRTLSKQDQAIAQMLKSYHEVMGQIGAKPDNALWEAAQDDYFPRFVKGFKGQKVDPFNTHRNVAWAKKLGIALERKKQNVVVGRDEDGNVITKQENMYKDVEDLKNEGFDVEENVANLQKYHWDAFSNMMLTHQFVKVLSTLDNFEETANVRRGSRVNPEGDRLTIPRNAPPYVGRVLVPRLEGGKAIRIGPDMRKQVTTVTRGPFEAALRNYLVYKPVAELLERAATTKATDNVGERIASVFAGANNTFKIFKFGFNPIHLFNLMSNIYTLGAGGLKDPATYNLFIGKNSLAHRIFGRTDALLQDITTEKNFDGTDITGKDMIAKIMHWGGVLPKDIIDVNNLGGLTGILLRRVPGFQTWHNIMWQHVAWKGQIGLTLHLMDVMRSEMEKELGRNVNEAEFENMGRMATQMAKYAMGFLTKDQMTRDWQIYGNAAFLANAWTTSQLRLLGMAIPKGLPVRDYLANIGGGETYNDVVSSQMQSLGKMTQTSLEKVNSYQVKMAQKMMLGGTVKLLIAASLLSAIGSYFGNQGQVQWLWQNYQRDPTHTFDIYLGKDQKTGKDQWAHNPLFGMQQELALYLLQAIKEKESGGNPYDILSSVGGRFANKLNPISSTALDLFMNRNLSLYLQGYGDRSDISKDPQVIAITRALDATGKNPFPDSFTNNLVYAVRTLFPSPGFPTNLDVSHGTNPSQTNATLGNVLNALGAGKVLGIGDIINAVQKGPGSIEWGNLIKTDLGGLAQWSTGSRITTSSTPAQVLQNNAISTSIDNRDARNQALADMAQAAQAGDWNTVAQISGQLGLTNNEMISALEHPPSGFGGGAGVLYAGLPSNQQAPLPNQDTLNGQELSVKQTSTLEHMKQIANIAMITQVTQLPEFQTGDKTTRTAMMASFVTLVNNLIDAQYAQQIGQTGGNPITNQDIQTAISDAIDFRRTAQEVLAQMQLYQQADPQEKQRMFSSYSTFAMDLASEATIGTDTSNSDTSGASSLEGVPIQNVREILTYTINSEETTKSFLENTMYYQLATPTDQQRMLSEYQSLARTMARREALGQGQGTYAFQIPPDKIIPTIEFIMSVEEAGKAALHSTDYYYNNPADQKTLDIKYETLARGLAFSTSAADPRVLIENSLAADQGYYDLQNQFGGSNYIKLMAQQLSDLERNVRATSDYTPQQISKMETAIRKSFLAQNPAYAQFLTTRTAWQKNTVVGQLYAALNNSEYAALSDMQAAGVIPQDTTLLSGTAIPQTVPLDIAPTDALPSIDYSTFAALNPDQTS